MRKILDLDWSIHSNYSLLKMKKKGEGKKLLRDRERKRGFARGVCQERSHKRGL